MLVDTCHNFCQYLYTCAFLVNRTDNSIKNHWNSSVKKKLDSYLKSGLLTKFQGLPLPQVGQQNQPMCTSSLRISGDDSGPKGAEAEEISECSQDSTVAGRFQSAGEMASAVLYTSEEFQNAEVSGSGKEPNSSPASCSEPYYPSLEDPAFSMTVISRDIDCATKFLQQNFSHDAEASMSGDYHFELHDIPNISSIELERESSGMQPYCLGINESQVANVPLQTSGGLTSSASVGIVHIGSDKPEHMLIPDDECCRVLFSETMNDECFSSRSLDLVGCTGPILCQSSNIQVSEAGGSAPSQHHPPSSDATGTSCSQSFFSSLLSSDDGPLIFGGDSDNLLVVQEQEYATCSRDGFIYTNDSANSPCNDGMDMTGMQEQLDILKDPSKLVPVNSYGSRSDTQTCPMDARPNVDKDEQDAGTLCYEPPRFPSFDGPFFSCDLIQSGSEMQQEYSPLGIRQLMMPSMNCLTPFRLWDSPTRDVSSPDAVLKSAAKTFTGTPSILKKRHREFLSPLSDRRKDKKLETDMTTSLTREFSRLDVVFDDCRGHKEPLQFPSPNQNRNSADPGEDKENQAHASEQDSEPVRGSTAFSEDKNAEKVLCDSEHQESTKQGASDVEDKTKIYADPTSQPSSGVLIEHNMNDLLLFSPKQVDFKARTPRNQHLKIFEPSPNRGISLKSSSLIHSASFRSPSLSGKKLKIQPVPEACGRRDSSSALPEMTGSNAGADVTVETFSM